VLSRAQPDTVTVPETVAPDASESIYTAGGWRTEGGITHFVVIAGKDGYDYLICDPGAGAAKGLYPLKEFGSKIEKLRFYEKVK